MSVKRTKLLSKHRKTVKTIEIEIDGERIKVAFKKPSFDDRTSVLDQAKEAGEMNEKNEPTSDKAGFRLIARMAVNILHNDEDNKPLFSVDDVSAIVKETWLEDITSELSEVFNVDAEKLKGK